MLTGEWKIWGLLFVCGAVVGFAVCFALMGGHRQTASLDADTQTKLDNIQNSQVEIKHLIQNIQNSQSGLINFIRVKNPKAVFDLPASTQEGGNNE